MVTLLLFFLALLKILFIKNLELFVILPIVVFMRFFASEKKEELFNSKSLKYYLKHGKKWQLCDEIVCIFLLGVLHFPEPESDLGGHMIAGLLLFFVFRTMILNANQLIFIFLNKYIFKKKIIS